MEPLEGNQQYADDADADNNDNDNADDGEVVGSSSPHNKWNRWGRATILNNNNNTLHISAFLTYFFVTHF